MANYGIIDLGSNTVRLVVYDVTEEGGGFAKRTKFPTVINDKVMAGLASYFEDGNFTQEGIDRAIEIVSGHLKRARYYGCKRLDIFATAVIRNAKNCNEALAAIEEGVGYKINLLSGEDEARLGYVGVSYDHVIDDGVLVDIGGGSTELTHVTNTNALYSVSFGSGSMTTYRDYVQNVLPRPDEMATIRAACMARLQNDPISSQVQTDTLYGIGGTVRGIAKWIAMYRGEKRPTELTREDVKELLNLCETNMHEHARVTVKACAERIVTITPGAIILDCIFEHTGASRIIVCRNGLREGYLLENML